MRPARPSSAFRRSHRGSAAVELALTLPLWFGLMVGTTDAFWLMAQRTTFVAAVEGGCRVGALADTGVLGANLPAVRDVVLARLTAEVETFEAHGCDTCDVALSIAGSVPVRQLHCQATRTIAPISSRWFSPITLTVTRSVHLQWQRPVAP